MAWERYRWQITSVLLALLAQSAMITWLLVERLGRHRAETRSRLLAPVAAFARRLARLWWPRQGL